MNPIDKLAFGWGARLPMVLQTEAAECGLACLAMVVGYHGQPYDITELRRRLSVSLKGVNLKHLVGMAERLGFAARPVRLELDELSQLTTPCVLHWDLNHFVVLAKVARDGDRDSRPGASACAACRWPRCPGTSPASRSS